MLAARITCPQCGTQLTVTEQAPPQVTCPRCLAALTNPASPLSGARPVPVIPLDEQVGRDEKAVNWMVYGMVALLLVAVALTLARGNGVGGVFVMIMVVALAAVIVTNALRRRANSPEGAPPTRSIDPSVPVDPNVPPTLAYSGARYDRHGRGALATAGAVAGGFFSALGVCAAGFLILAYTADMKGGSTRQTHDTHTLILGGVVMLVIGFLVATVFVSRRWRGFGPGAAAGLCLGLLALGPCAACYLLTLG
jgi:hypothetical protein